MAIRRLARFAVWAIALALFPWGCAPGAAPASSASQRNFHEADRRIAEGELPVTVGNTDRATEMARGLASEVARGLASSGAVSAWCELHTTYCAFLVHVPGGTLDGRLADSAWSAALGQLDDMLPGQDLELVVALRNESGYGPIRLGKSESDPAPKSLDGKAEETHRFFVRPTDRP